MTIFQALILALTQGLTEFLPVSSSGHLVIIQKLLGFTTPPVFFDIVLHAGTLLAVVVYFWKDILQLIINWRKNLPFIAGLIVASVPAGLVGIFLNSQVELIFSSTKYVGIALLITGLILLLTRWIKKIKTTEEPNIRQSLIIGLFQAIAIMPGISRSGSTISAGLFSGLTPNTAFRYSFLLAIPTILGAFLLQLMDVPLYNIDWGITTLGFVVASLVGFFALTILSRVLQKGNLYYFSFYCFALGLICLFFLS